MQPPLLADRPTLLTSKQPPTLTAEKEAPAEERSDSEEEETRPSEEYSCCGVDLKPFLPVTLAISTLIGGICMILFQIPLLCRRTSISYSSLVCGYCLVYGTTVGCMMYTACADPGQVKPEKKGRSVELGADIEQGMASVPLRAHQSFQYDRPILRYDHFCKWLNNVIGLMNHREFIVTLLGLMCIAVLGIVVDIYLTCLVIAEDGLIVEGIETKIILALHLSYSVLLLKTVFPIIRIHFGLISRNEMGKEWKHHLHYVANATTKGDNVYVHQLDDDEFNDLLDGGAFIYDRSRNPFDKGGFRNCLNFWCQARWTPNATGEF